MLSLSEPVPGNVATSCYRILIVDDEPFICATVKRALEYYHHRVKVAGDAEAALALMEAEAFDLVIVDYHLPGMRGDHLAAAVKAKNPGQQVVLASGSLEGFSTSGSTIPDVDFILTKPFTISDLRNIIHHALEVQSVK